MFALPTILNQSSVPVFQTGKYCPLDLSTFNRPNPFAIPVTVVTGGFCPLNLSTFNRPNPFTVPITVVTGGFCPLNLEVFNRPAGISINPIATDNVIHPSEQNTPLTISGIAYLANGLTLTVNLNGVNYTTTVSNDTWSVTVPAVDLQAIPQNLNYTVTASVLKNGVSSFGTSKIYVGDPIVLDLRFDGADNATTATDFSSFNHTVTFVGTAKLSTTQKKYGTASFRASATTAEFGYLSISSSLFTLNSTTDFCIEMWLYRPSAINTTGGLMTLDPNNVNRPVEIVSAGSTAPNRLSNNANSTTGTGANNGGFGDGALNTWVHIALTREGSLIKGYLNGVLAFTRTTNNIDTSGIPGNVVIGCYNNAAFGSGQTFDGWIDSFRFTRGIPKYTANFNPETDTGLAY